MEDLTSLLAPFSDEDQAVLLEVDNACSIQAQHVKAEMDKASLSGGEYKVDLETLTWMKITKAYGILMNRAIEAGWVEGVMTGNKTVQ
jgi:hypothetical protein